MADRDALRLRRDTFGDNFGFGGVMTKFLTALTAVLMVWAAAPASAQSEWPRTVDGLVVTASDHDFETTWNQLIAALESNPNIGVVATIDHAAAAASAGLELDPNRVVVFGNPALGTPIMAESRSAALDLPQKIQVFEQDGTTFVAYNPPAYLVARHDVGGVSTPDVIGAALEGLVEAGTGADVVPRVGPLRIVTRYPGLDTVDSAHDFDTTWSRLLSAIDASPASVAFTVDHAANAQSAGLDLAPTRLVVFGNPNLGTPLMQAAPTAGIDLPLKVLVWEDGSGVHVTYTDPGFIRNRHGVVGLQTLVTTMRGAVDSFVVASTG